MKKAVIAVVLVLVIGLVAAAVAMNRSDSNGDRTQQQTANQTEDTAPQARPNEVQIADYNFTPATITVKKGTTVTWTNTDTVRHNVVADGDEKPGGLPQEAPLFGKDETFSHTFDTVGTFEYLCEPHPYMKGKVVVEE